MDRILEELFEQAYKQAAMEISAEYVHIGSVKTIGIVSDIANTLKNTEIITRAAKENIGVVSNSVIAGLGVYTGGCSALQYSISTDKKAKGLYAASVVFSASAVVSGGLAAASRTCNISGTAAISETFGLAFMKLGNKAHVTALQLEGKPIPPKLKHLMDPSIRPLPYDPNGLGFVMPNTLVSSRVIAAIPFERIGQVIGFGVAVYGYSRVAVIAYRYGQQFLSKYKNNRKARLIRERKILLMFTLKLKMQRIVLKARRKPKHNLFFSAG